MPTRLAAILACIAFSVCLVVGGLEAQNTFVTTVGRALVAMAGTFCIGLIIGAMGRRMVDESVAGAAPLKEKNPDLQKSSAKNDR